MISGLILCNNILKRAFEERVIVNPRKLQKLIYYTALEYLRCTQQMLLSEDFLVWQHGPVVQSVYESFKCYDDSPIVTFSRDGKGNVLIVDETKEIAVKSAIDAVWYHYKDYTGEQLTEISHAANSGWSLARANKQNTISKTFMELELSHVSTREVAN